MDSDKLKTLQTAIEVYENDFIHGYTGNEDYEVKRHVFASLIVALTREVHDFRYCSKKECSCSPESEIKTLWEENKEFFSKMFGPYSLSTHSPLLVVDYIESMINED